MTQPAGSRPDWHVRLRRILDTYFDQGELETLCFDLRFDFEELPGVGKSEKVVELIKAFSRMGRIEELIDYCSQLRPNVPWAELRDEAVRHPFVVEGPPERREPAPTGGFPVAGASAATGTIPATGASAHPGAAPPDVAHQARDDVAPGRRRHRGVWVAVAAIVVALFAVFGWCAVSWTTCPWEAESAPTAGLGVPPTQPPVDRTAPAGETTAPTTEPGRGTILTMVPIPVWDPWMPEQISPPDGSVFDTYPRTTTLQWSPVQNAQSYTVELDCLHCCVSGGWCTDVGEAYQVVPGITAESYTFDWVGAQPGRWRVWATTADGTEHRASPWWRFEYTR